MAEEAFLLPARWQAQQQAPWHEPVWAQISLQLRNERLPQGLLLLGAEGVGKLALARRIAMAAQCGSRDSQTQQACGGCEDCQQILAGVHPDLSLMMPAAGKRRISVEAVREFSHRLYLTAQKGTSRVGIISPAEAMTESASNALLKTLEEPPAGVTIILLASRVSGLSATIRSRCQILKMPNPDSEMAAGWLADQFALDKQNLSEALVFDGPFSLYERLFSSEEKDQSALSAPGRDMVRSLQALEQDSADCVAIATDWRAEGQSALEKRLQWLYEASSTELAIRVGGQGKGESRQGTRPLQGLALTSLLDLPKRCMTIKRELQTQVNEQSLVETFLLVLHQYLLASKRT